MKINYDKSFYMDIKNVLICDYSIPYDIFKHANLMDIDITKLFCDNLTASKNKDALISQILGIYGNYFATHEFIMKGYKVENEYEVITDDKQKTKADIAYYENDEIVLCEVKMAMQIILNKKNYVNFNNLTSKKDIVQDKRKYFEIANKLLKQVSKLKKVSNHVKVIVFENCYMDKDLIDALKKEGINKDDILIIPVDVKELYNNVKNMVENIFLKYEKNV